MNHNMHHTGLSSYSAVLSRRLYALIGLWALIAIVPAADAFTNTNNLNVSVVVPPVVQLSVTSMNFGTAPTTQSVQATAVITINMVATQAYHITIDAGLHKATERRISNGAGSFRSYLLYKDAARTQLWGDAGFASSYAVGSAKLSTGTGANQTFTVYGTSPATTGISGSYSDQVTVTVHY